MNERRKQVDVGITAPVDRDALAYGAIAWAVRLAGGHPIKITTGMSWRNTRIDALVIGGGADVFPAYYDQDAIEGARYNRSRDEMEMYWARKARDSFLPTLAICRGAQVMNVAGGGSLHQNLSEIYDDVDYPSTFLGQVFYRKSVSITADSLLRELINRKTVRVNSIHSQAIARVAKNLTVTAQEANGVIQAIEDRRRRFYLGVQFHPEFLVHRGMFRRLFKGLVEAGREMVSQTSPNAA